MARSPAASAQHGVEQLVALFDLVSESSQSLKKFRLVGAYGCVRLRLTEAVVTSLSALVQRLNSELDLQLQYHKIGL